MEPYCSEILQKQTAQQHGSATMPLVLTLGKGL